MEEEDLFLQDSPERRQSTLQGSMEDNEKLEENRLKRDLRKKAVSDCCKTYWLKRFPVITWIRTYSVEFLITDMIAGITVGLTAIPQGVAYAVVAGLQPQYGLYSGYMACFVYFFLGTVKDVTIGPTAIMALLVHSYVEKYNSDFAVLSCFLAGCVTLLLGVFHMGFLVNFISLPVTVGFTTAAALTIASSQLKPLFGIPGRSNEFLPSLIATITNLTKTRIEDFGLGIVTIAFLVGTKILNERVSSKYRDSVSINKSAKFYLGALRFMSLGRNGIAVIFGTLAAFLFSRGGLSPFTLTGKVGHGFPKLSLPPFSTYVTVNNETVYLSFEDMAEILKTSIVSIPMISILETIAIGKIFSKGNTLNATQEMIALGVSNILGSFVQSMPTAGSFTRSVINNASGVRTPLGGLFTGVIVLSALAITHTFEYIPKATLAAVILTAMYYMIDYHEFVLIWKVKRIDMIPLWVTIICCLAIGLDLGILLGILVNLLFILYTNIKPKIAHEETTVLGQEIIVFHLNQTPVYVGAEYVRNSIMKSLRFKKKAVVVLNGSFMLDTDSTTIRTFKVMGENFAKQQQEYAFWNWPPIYKELLSRLNEEVASHFHNTDTLEQLLQAINLRNTGGA